MARKIGKYDILKYEFFEVVLPDMLYKGTKMEQYEVILNLIADGTGYIRELFRTCCKQDGVKYPYKKINDIHVSMLSSCEVYLFQIDLPEYNRNINDIARVYIVFNERDGEILFKTFSQNGLLRIGKSESYILIRKKVDISGLI